MNETRNDLTQKVQDKTAKNKLPYLLPLIGVLLMLISLFLPYMTAVGELSDYIEEYPDRMEIESLELTAGDLKNIPVISVSKLITGVYGEDDGAIAKVIVLTFGGFMALSALFVILKKPVAAIVFDLLTCGVFFLLNTLMKDDFISANKYAWGIGWYILIIAAVVVFVGAAWMRIAIRKVQTTMDSVSVQ